MPTTIGAVLVIVAFVIPGFIASRVLSSAYPRSEPAEGRLILEGITLSCANYALLSWLLILAWDRRWYESALVLVALALLVLLLTPVVIGLVLVKAIDTNWGRRFRHAFGIVHPVPKAWDYFFRQETPCWIVATMKDGRVVAGLYRSNSFASSFPSEEDLYLEKLCKLSPQGKIEGVADFSMGGIIRMENVQLLELFDGGSGDIK
ncbi:MAG: DUF6338 family protein [Candidatus Acidiferrales bacterium]